MKYKRTTTKDKTNLFILTSVTIFSSSFYDEHTRPPSLSHTHTHTLLLIQTEVKATASNTF